MKLKIIVVCVYIPLGCVLTHQFFNWHNDGDADNLIGAVSVWVGTGRQVTSWWPMLLAIAK